MVHDCMSQGLDWSIAAKRSDKALSFSALTWRFGEVIIHQWALHK